MGGEAGSWTIFSSVDVQKLSLSLSLTLDPKIRKIQQDGGEESDKNAFGNARERTWKHWDKEEEEEELQLWFIDALPVDRDTLWLENRWSI